MSGGDVEGLTDLARGRTLHFPEEKSRTLLERQPVRAVFDEGHCFRGERLAFGPPGHRRPPAFLVEAAFEDLVDWIGGEFLLSASPGFMSFPIEYAEQEGSDRGAALKAMDHIEESDESRLNEFFGPRFAIRSTTYAD